MTAAWLAGNALAFDLETTGPDPETARIVTAHAVEVGPGGATVRGSWLVNPGVEIPAEATAIHGVTTEQARALGLAPFVAVPALVACLKQAWEDGLPVIAMNASFDLTITLREWREHISTKDFTVGPVLDPLVIDRGIEPYRKGKRNLTALATHYGVKQGAAHSAEGDALTAARIVWAQAKRHWALEKHTLEQMQEWQRECHAKWAAHYAEYLASIGAPQVIDGDWPIRKQLEAA